MISKNGSAENTPAHARVPLGIGDDMAVVKLGTGAALLKIDQCLDGVHFDLHKTTPPPRPVARPSTRCSFRLRRHGMPSLAPS